MLDITEHTDQELSPHVLKGGLTKGHAMTHLTDITNIDDLIAAIQEAGHTDAEIASAGTTDERVIIRRGDFEFTAYWDRDGEGWAYRTRDDDDPNRDSGALDDVDQIAALLPVK